MQNVLLRFRLSRCAVRASGLGVLFILASAAGAAGQTKPFVSSLSLDGLTFVSSKGEVTTYRSAKAIRLTEAPGGTESMAVLNATDFQDGAIELNLAGVPAAGAPESARGFVGVAFRVAPDNTHFECFYLRPTNGRADDQLRRNHSTQYISAPDYPWERLRKENPGVYESYVDLEAGAWTKVKIVVTGKKAALYVHGAAQPALIVNDLKGEAGHGKIALWIGAYTEGYFSEIKVTPKP